MEAVDGVQVALQAGALAVSVLTAFAVDRLGERRGLLPPYFASGPRRGLALAVLAGLFYFLLWSPLAGLGGEPATGAGAAPALPDVPVPVLFAGHVLMLGALLAWYALGFEPGEPGRLRERFAAQLGLATERPFDELWMGLVGGGAVWVAMIAVMVVVVGLAMALFGEEVVPKQAPEAIVFMAGLPLAVRIALGLSAGFVEELFFRGFLQARIGIGLSTFLFVLGHAGYQQPFMLAGLTAISLILGLLVRWRQSIWAAVVAHAMFDLVQLLVIIPVALKYTGGLPVAL